MESRKIDLSAGPSTVTLLRTLAEVERQGALTLRQMTDAREVPPWLGALLMGGMEARGDVFEHLAVERLGEEMRVRTAALAAGAPASMGTSAAESFEEGLPAGEIEARVMSAIELRDEQVATPGRAERAMSARTFARLLIELVEKRDAHG